MKHAKLAHRPQSINLNYCSALGLEMNSQNMFSWKFQRNSTIFGMNGQHDTYIRSQMSFVEIECAAQWKFEEFIGNGLENAK